MLSERPPPRTNIPRMSAPLDRGRLSPSCLEATRAGRGLPQLTGRTNHWLDCDPSRKAGVTLRPGFPSEQELSPGIRVQSNSGVWSCLRLSLLDAKAEFII